MNISNLKNTLIDLGLAFQSDVFEDAVVFKFESMDSWDGFEKVELHFYSPDMDRIGTIGWLGVSHHDRDYEILNFNDFSLSFNYEKFFKDFILNDEKWIKNLNYIETCIKNILLKEKLDQVLQVNKNIKKSIKL